MFGIKVLQILWEHFLGFHLHIPVLKFSIELVYLSCEGTKLQMIGPKYLIDLEMLQSDFKFGIGNTNIFCKNFNVISCLVNQSLKIFSDRFL